MKIKKNRNNKRRESMRGLYEQLKAIVPVEYRGERPSTAKLLTSAARFIQVIIFLNRLKMHKSITII